MTPEMNEGVSRILEEKITKGKRKTGREGMKLWQIFVISELRAGLDTINLEKPQMKPETREYLKNLYREDILKLQTLINRDLSHWLR
jgi:hypothetical protein